MTTSFTTEAPFEFGIKAVEVREDNNGDLILEGYAADFLTDRDAEAFEPGALERGMKGFMANPILLYHHKPGVQLGLVEDVNRDGKGVRVRARFPKPPDGSGEIGHIYNLVKRGMMRGFSVGGKFQRHMTPTGPRIFDMDWMELSVTPLPVNPRTLFGVAGKAFGEQDDSDAATAEDLVSRLDTVFNTLERLRS